MFGNQFLPVFCLFIFVDVLAAVNMDLVESCTDKLKAALGSNSTLNEKLNNVAKSEKSLIGFYISTINELCNNKEINATVTFFTENAASISSLTEFTQTLTPEEVEEFTKLQKNGKFTDELTFIKNKYDSATKKEKSKLHKLLHQIIPMLLRGRNVKPAVVNYFNSLSANDLIKIMTIAENHNLKDLKTFVVGTFKQLGLNKTDRATVGTFIDSIHKIKKAAAKQASRKVKPFDESSPYDK